MPGNTVLVIDEDPQLLAEISALLQALGFQPLEWSGLVGAYEALLALQPDLLMLRLVFSDQKHGVDLLTVLKLRPQTQALPVILYCDNRSLLQAFAQRLRERPIPGCWTLNWPTTGVELSRLLYQILPSARPPGS